jgi:hypothetical protein
VAVALGAVLSLCFVPVAGAKVVYDALTQKHYGVSPAAGATQPLSTAAPFGAARASNRSKAIGTQGGSAVCEDNSGTPQSVCAPLQYGGGPVQHGPEKEYLFFWAPSNYPMPASFETGMEAWLDDLVSANGTSGNPVSVVTQYYDSSRGSKSFIPYQLVKEAPIIDTNPYPSNQCTDVDGSNGSTPTPVCLTDAQIQQELYSYITAPSHHLPAPDLNTEYFVLTPPGVGSCFDASSSSCAYTGTNGYCGYHSYRVFKNGVDSTQGSLTTTYAVINYAYGTACDVGAGNPNPGFIDSTVGVFSHELSETMTDPNVSSGWLDSSGLEVGDKCAYIYDAEGPNSYADLSTQPGGSWNVNLGSHYYLLQQEFDNNILSCATRLTDTWGGGASPTTSWSSSSNWAAAYPPGVGTTSGADALVDTLSFPASATAYAANNDLSYTVNAYGLQVDDGSGYALSGNAIELGAGGIAATSAGGSNASTLSLPLSLQAPQSWTIDGGSGHLGQLNLAGVVTGGSSDTVHATLQNGGSLVLGADDELGAATISGANTGDTGASASTNGIVTVQSKLNATNGRAVGLTDAELNFPGSAAAGPLTSTGGDIEVGHAGSAATLSVSGAFKQTAASRLTLFATAGGSSEVTATGAVTLAGALNLAFAACPTAVNTVYTLISTTGSVSGAFSGLPSGATIPYTCPGPQLPLMISYSGTAVKATVAPPPATPRSQPTISGAPQQGQQLTVTNANWTGSGTITIANQWEDCDQNGSNCQPIFGANGQTYTLQGSDVGHTIVVSETANNGTNSAPDPSQPTPAPPAVVTEAPAPTASSPPTISGTAKQGQSLTASPAAWSGALSTAAYSYQWEDCNASGASCTGIAAATGQTYTPASSDVGHTIRVVEMASNGFPSNTSSAQSAPTATVASSQAATTTPPPPVTPSASAPTLSGTSVTVPVRCTGTGPGRCVFVITVATTETLAGTRVIALAAAKRRGKRTTRVLVVGSESVTLSAGQTMAVVVALNAAGRRLLSARRSLPVKITIVAGGGTLSVSTRTFRRPRRSHGLLAHSAR